MALRLHGFTRAQQRALRRSRVGIEQRLAYPPCPIPHDLRDALTAVLFASRPNVDLAYGGGDGGSGTPYARSAGYRILLYDISRREALKESRQRQAHFALSEAIKKLLASDLPRQDHFVDTKVVRVDFGADEIAVNNETTFSASSQVFLKKAFHSGLLVASFAQDYFRFPRFLILDGIEDGGMEIERSHHLQNLIVELSGTLGVDHQIIIGTSQIAPNLDVPAHTVGREFTHEMKSLQLSGIS